MKRATTHTKTRGQLVREALTGAWRKEPPEPRLSAAELMEAAPLLLGSGAAGLAWWRIRHTSLRHAEAAEELERAYQLNVMQATFQEQQIGRVYELLRASRVEALLVKGWAVARAYPARGLRPSGDIDLVIRPDQREAARTVLAGEEARQYFVDFEHEEFERLDASAWDALYSRSEAVIIGGEEVRLMCAEDHLRFLSIHLLRHGAWRPLWLADVAAVLESRSESFDWGRCLGAERRRADWVACALALAQKLLGARLDGTPECVRARPLPLWLVSSVLKQWERPCVIDRLPPELMETSLRHPARIFGAVLRRWPDPVQATIRMRGPINRLPRLPFQLGEYAVKTAAFMTRLPKLRREQER